MDLPLKSPEPGGRRRQYRIQTKSLSYNLPARAPAFHRQCYGMASSSTSRVILRNVSCEAQQGELLAIVGPSGSGKTTLLSILAGVIHPSRVSGEILVNGRRMDVSRFRRVSGYVTQDDALFPLLTADDPASTAADENYPPINYHHGPCPFRDCPALLLFLLLSLSTIALGLIAVARRNPAASHASSFVFDPATSSCVLSSSNSLSFSFSSSSSSPFLKDLSWTLVVTLLLASPIAFAVLWLLRHSAKQVVCAALPFFILIPAFVNVYWFAAYGLSHGCHHSFPK